MKKTIFFATMAAFALVSCSNDDSIKSDDVALGESSEPIVLGTSGVATVTTRSIGTVGDVEGKDHTLLVEGEDFQNQQLYVLMSTCSGDRTATPWTWTKHNEKPGESSPLNPLFAPDDNGYFTNNKAFPKIEHDGLYRLEYEKYNGVTKYYPLSGSSDFFAVHIDDAAYNTAVGYARGHDSEHMEDYDYAYLPIVINGSQDLLAGKAENADTVINGQKVRMGFSAKRVRENSDDLPVINLKHLLTRLTFSIRVDGHSKTEGATVAAIQVLTKTHGNMIVAYDRMDTIPSKELIRDWAYDPIDDNNWVSLKGKSTHSAAGDVEMDTNPKSKHLNDLEPLTLRGGIEEVKSIGHALFVKPGEQSYKMRMAISMPYDDGTATQPNTTVYPQLSIPLPAGESEFGVGKSYHVEITVHGLNEIFVNATLKSWEQYGETIDIDVDEDVDNDPDARN